MSDWTPTPVACASYTHARRHPKVLGRIGGWAPPVQLSFVQLGTLAVTLIAMAGTWEVWSSILPPLGRLLVLVVVPTSTCWAVRRSRLEGRSLVRTAMGFVTLMCQPARGTLRGRPAPSDRIIDWSSATVWLAPVPQDQQT